MHSNHPTDPVCVRQKLLKQGVKSLSDIELLSIILNQDGSISANYKPIDAQILSDNFGNLRDLINADLKHLEKINPSGENAFIKLQTAKEICRRVDWMKMSQRSYLKQRKETITFLKRQLRDKKNETFVALFLDSQNGIICYEELFHGTIDNITVYFRPIIDRTLQLNAAAIIVAHNHPSGHCLPSFEDKVLTKRLTDALDLIDTKLLDHLVIGDNEVYSIIHGFQWSCEHGL